jgi:hypothetical protein
MARNSDGSGLAGDVVQQVSGRLTAAATWLGDRDPGSVLTEVKRYARRRPGTFILAAAIGGIVVGRLTRALAANASDEKDASASAAPAAPVAPPAPAPRQVHPDPAIPVPVGTTTVVGGETPVYSQTASGRPDALREGDYDRPDTV